MSELVRGERPGLTLWEQLLRCGRVRCWRSSRSASPSGTSSRASSRTREYPYVVNSVAKDSLLAGLSLLVFWDVRRWAAVAVPLIVIAHLLMPIVMLLTGLVGRGRGDRPHLDRAPVLGRPSSAWAGSRRTSASSSRSSVLHWKAVRSRYDLRYLPPSAFRALMALAEVLVLREDRDDRPRRGGRCASTTTSRASARARSGRSALALLALAYWPLLTAAAAVPRHVAGPAPALGAAALPRRGLRPAGARADPRPAPGPDPRRPAVLLHGLLRRRARGQEGRLRAVLAQDGLGRPSTACDADRRARHLHEPRGHPRRGAHRGRRRRRHRRRPARCSPTSSPRAGARC